MRRSLAWKPKPRRLRRRPPVSAVTRKTAAARGSRTAVPNDARFFVWQRDGGRCRNCGSRDELQFDHIIPVALGGSNCARNIELLCQSCNLAKGIRLVAPGVNEAVQS